MSYLVLKRLLPRTRGRANARVRRRPHRRGLLERGGAASAGAVVGGLLSVSTIAAKCVLGHAWCSLPPVYAFAGAVVGGFLSVRIKAR